MSAQSPKFINVFLTLELQEEDLALSPDDGTIFPLDQPMWNTDSSQKIISISGRQLHTWP